MKITAVTCVKNEGPFLLEWIAFNRVIGVTDFLVYSNDCTDATDELLDALEEIDVVTHLPNPAQGRNYQMEALAAAKSEPVVKNADWVWVADVDEFLNIHVGDGTISALIDACGDPQAISIGFQFFANDGIEKFVDEPVIGQFSRSHNPDIWCDQTAIEVKSLCRSDFPVQYYGAHRPFFRKDLPEPRLPDWSDGSGRPVPDAFRDATTKRRYRKFPAKGTRKFATLNHYALRSLESYLVKNDRGDVNRENRDFDDTYWRERNDGSYLDSSIQTYLPSLLAEIARLKSNPKIAQLHERAVECHRQSLDRLMGNSEYAELYKSLRLAAQISPQEQAVVDLLSSGSAE